MQRLPARRRIGAIAALAVAAMVATPVTAGAAPYEPNDTVAQAFGPLVGGQDYEAVKETENDPDYYYFNVVGQRQLDISVTRTGGSSCSRIHLLDPDGNEISRAYIETTINHLKYSTAGNSQFVLSVTGDESCAYRFRVDPADAITTAAPGVVVTLNALEQSDDSQRVVLDGREVGSLQGVTGPTTLSLGVLAPTARLTFEARNQTGGWSWNVKITNQESRTLVTTFTESQSNSDGARVGVVRRVTMSPSGGIFDTCGEAVAPTICDPPLPPPVAGPSQACLSARSRRAASARRVSATKKALKRARKRSTRRKLSRRLTTQRRDLSRRTAAMRAACAV